VKVVKEKEMISINDEAKGEKHIDSRSSKRREGEKKKRNEKIIYYNSDSSSSSQKDANDSSSSKKKMVKHDYSKTSFNYPCIPYNSNLHVL
jgi:hypothetical protein